MRHSKAHLGSHSITARIYLYEQDHRDTGSCSSGPSPRCCTLVHVAKAEGGNRASSGQHLSRSGTHRGLQPRRGTHQPAQMNDEVRGVVGVCPCCASLDASSLFYMDLLTQAFLPGAMPTDPPPFAQADIYGEDIYASAGLQAAPESSHVAESGEVSALSSLCPVALPYPPLGCGAGFPVCPRPAKCGAALQGGHSRGDNANEHSEMAGRESGGRSADTSVNPCTVACDSGAARSPPCGRPSVAKARKGWCRALDPKS